MFYATEELPIDLIHSLHHKKQLKRTVRAVTAENFRILSLQDAKVYENITVEPLGDQRIDLKNYFSKNQFLP